MDVRRVQRAERERECEQTLILGFLCSFRNHFSYFDEMVEVVYLMNSHLRKMTSALRKQYLKRKKKYPFWEPVLVPTVFKCNQSTISTTTKCSTSILPL